MENDFHTKPRLFVSSKLFDGSDLILDQDQSHYLAHVLRAVEGDVVRLFNGVDGEYRATITQIRKRDVTLGVQEVLREQKSEPDIWLFSAPIKRSHFDDLVMKATELGVAEIHPILTGRTQIRDINRARLHAIAVEAAEQSERLNVPVIHEAVTLDKALASWPVGRLPLVCAEFGEALPIHDTLTKPDVRSAARSALVTGPEGGFMPEELAALSRLPNAHLLRLGPRILRADTAAMAALACWQSVCGDWQTSL